MRVKFILFGPECTGKSTMAKALAAHYQEPLATEYLRHFAQEKWDHATEKVDQSDIEDLLKGQMAQEVRAENQAKNFVFLDTNTLQLAVYFDHYYDRKWPVHLKNLVQQQGPEFYFLTAPDVPWVSDDLRDRPLERLSLFHIFEQALKSRDLPYLVLRGDQKARFAAATNYIDIHWPQ